MKRKLYRRRPVKALLKISQMMYYLPIILVIYYIALKKDNEVT